MSIDITLFINVPYALAGSSMPAVSENNPWGLLHGWSTVPWHFRHLDTLIHTDISFCQALCRAQSSSGGSLTFRHIRHV